MLLVRRRTDDRLVKHQNVESLARGAATIADLNDAALAWWLEQVLPDVMSLIADEPRRVDKRVVRLGGDLESLTWLRFLQGIAHWLGADPKSREISLFVNPFDVDRDRLFHEDILVLGVGVPDPDIFPAFLVHRRDVTDG